jgi:hypothetical protein
MNGKEFGIPQVYGNYPIRESQKNENHRRSRISKVPEMAIIRDFGHEFDIVLNANLETQVEGFWVSGDGRLDYAFILDPATRPDKDFNLARPGGFLKEERETKQKEEINDRFQGTEKMKLIHEINRGSPSF